MIGLSNGPGFTPKKPQFFKEKMLRLLDIFFLKNSSPFFLKPWRVRTSNLNILLIGAIKHYNFFYCHFLLRPFLSEMFAGPFHQAKAESSSRTVLSLTAHRYLEKPNADFSKTGVWRNGQGPVTKGKGARCPLSLIYSMIECTKRDFVLFVVTEY